MKPFAPEPPIAPALPPPPPLPVLGVPFNPIPGVLLI